ncbi:MAG TPA: hypothetical protein VK892_21060 [Pyrinomonadaceae bacterium]|nr:hypothetical protein [Pyrinomonadaceae bacterium]
MKRVTPSLCLIIIFSVFCFGQKQNAEQKSARETFNNSEKKISRILNLRISGSSVSQKNASEGGSGGSLLEGAEKAVDGFVTITSQSIGNAANSVGQTKEGAARTIGRLFGGVQISPSARASGIGEAAFLADKENLQFDRDKTFILQIKNSIKNLRNNFCWIV